MNGYGERTNERINERKNGFYREDIREIREIRDIRGGRGTDSAGERRENGYGAFAGGASARRGADETRRLDAERINGLNERNRADEREARGGRRERDERNERIEKNGRIERDARGGEVYYANAERQRRAEGQVALVPRAPRYTKSKSSRTVAISSRALFAIIFLIVFLFVSFLAVAFLPSDDPYKSEKTENNENKLNVENKTETGKAASGGETGSDASAIDPPQGTAAGAESPVICIDPGHGYDDVGTSYKYLGDLTEKDITLSVALLAASELREMGYKVIMTRDSDTPPSDIKPNENGDRVINPAWRCDFANKNGADLFVSFHCNSYERDENVSGARIYYFSDSKYPSSKLAEEISKAVGEMSKEKPSVTGLGGSEAYAVTKKVEAPSALIEMGFVTNREDTADMTDASWQKRMAHAAARGISSYINSVNSHG